MTVKKSEKITNVKQIVEDCHLVITITGDDEDVPAYYLCKGNDNAMQLIIIKLLLLSALNRNHQNIMTIIKLNQLNIMRPLRFKWYIKLVFTLLS